MPPFTPLADRTNVAKPSSVKGIGNMADNKRDSFSSPQLATAVAPLPEPVAEVSSESPCEAAKTASLGQRAGVVQSGPSQPVWQKQRPFAHTPCSSEPQS